jgi:mannitol/fructose-specific phosphotransferase system IIA component (Ntr-type)
LKELVQVISSAKAVNNKLDFYKAISEREEIGSTGIGMGIAIPHAWSKCVNDFVIALGRKPEGISFESVDGQLVNLVVMIGAPVDRGEEMLRILAKTVLMLKNPRFRKKLIEAKSKSEIMQLFKDK